jgi:hypothetical protein
MAMFKEIKASLNGRAETFEAIKTRFTELDEVFKSLKGLNRQPSTS